MHAAQWDCALPIPPYARLRALHILAGRAFKWPPG